MQGFLLALELQRWRRAGRRPQFWWRDDDAREDTVALRRLLSLAASARTPLTVAAIPDGDRASLGQALTGAAQVTVVQHGVDHVNRTEEGGSSEFPADADAAGIGAALALGWLKLAPLPGALKVFVPPWNAIHPALPQALQAQGYAGWSAWALTAPSVQPPRVDAHLDILRWKGGARFRGTGPVHGRLRRLLVERRRSGAWNAPIGLLTHHLDHDTAAWAFLDRFVRRRDFDWLGLPQVLVGDRLQA